MNETKYRSIDVDFDVFQLIVLEKQCFDESDNEALRRLLGLCNSFGPSPPPLKNGNSEPWIGKAPLTSC